MNIFTGNVSELPLTIVTPLQDQEVLEKQPTVWTCEVSKPDRPAKWFAGGKEIVSGGRYEIRVDGTRHTLTITSTEQADQMEYNITFVDVSSAASLFVTGSLMRFHNILLHLFDPFELIETNL